MFNNKPSFKPQQAPAPSGAGNLDKLALARAIMGRMPGERQPGMTAIKPLKTSLSKVKKF